MKQITVNVENEVGVIAGVTSVLSNNGINILSLSTEVMEDAGVIFITTEDEDHDKALWWLADAGYKAMTDETLVITMPDEPGALAKVAERFRDHDINIQSLHIINRAHGHTTVSLSTDNQDKARGASQGSTGGDGGGLMTAISRHSRVGGNLELR